MIPSIQEKENQDNLTNEIHSVWLLGIFWTAAHMGPFLCTVILYCIIKNADGQLVLSYHLKERHIVYILFYCFLGLSVLGFCSILILRTIDWRVRHDNAKGIEILKWRIRFSLLVPFVLFLANSLELAMYLFLLIENITGNGYRLTGFWGCFLVALSIIIFLVIIIMTASIFVAASRARRLKQALVKTLQHNNEPTPLFNQDSWSQPYYHINNNNNNNDYDNNNNNNNWIMNNMRVPPPVATIPANMAPGNPMRTSYLPYMSPYPTVMQDSSSWPSQAQNYNVNNLPADEYAMEPYIRDPARYL